MATHTSTPAWNPPAPVPPTEEPGRYFPGVTESDTAEHGAPADHPVCTHITATLPVGPTPLPCGVHTSIPMSASLFLPYK